MTRPPVGLILPPSLLSSVTVQARGRSNGPLLLYRLRLMERETLNQPNDKASVPHRCMSSLLSCCLLYVATPNLAAAFSSMGQSGPSPCCAKHTLRKLSVVC